MASEPYLRSRIEQTAVFVSSHRGHQTEVFAAFLFSNAGRVQDIVMVHANKATLKKKQPRLSRFNLNHSSLVRLTVGMQCFKSVLFKCFHSALNQCYLKKFTAL